ncbi:MAG TPA: response regulator transcription factor [Actinomycetota bacterium]|nr:response regulator transcription factor [Actinomycetota bacterium]
MTTNGDKHIRLLICDDHKVVADALATIARMEGDIDVLEDPVGDPERAIALCEKHRPDVVLMDVELGRDIDGIDATRRIKKVSPMTNVVIISGHDPERLLVQAVEAGPSGFLNKAEAIADVLATVRAAAAGEVLVDPATLTRLLQKISTQRAQERESELLLRQLTDREREVLQLLAEGMPTEDVAADLTISPHTAQTHVRNILGKLGVRSKLEAVVFAAQKGVVTVGSRRS